MAASCRATCRPMAPTPITVALQHGQPLRRHEVALPAVPLLKIGVALYHGTASPSPSQSSGLAASSSMTNCRSSGSMASKASSQSSARTPPASLLVEVLRVSSNEENQESGLTLALYSSCQASRSLGPKGQL